MLQKLKQVGSSAPLLHSKFLERKMKKPTNRKRKRCDRLCDTQSWKVLTNEQRKPTAETWVYMNGPNQRTRSNHRIDLACGLIYQNRENRATCVDNKMQNKKPKTNAKWTLKVNGNGKWECMQQMCNHIHRLFGRKSQKPLAKMSVYGVRQRRWRWWWWWSWWATLIIEVIPLLTLKMALQAGRTAGDALRGPCQEAFVCALVAVRNHRAPSHPPTTVAAAETAAATDQLNRLF